MSLTFIHISRLFPFGWRGGSGKHQKARPAPNKFQAILARAFRGELVPTQAELARREGRPYETASELLARIKSEKELKSKPAGINRIRGPRERKK